MALYKFRIIIIIISIGQRGKRPERYCAIYHRGKLRREGPSKEMYDSFVEMIRSTKGVEAQRRTK